MEAARRRPHGRLLIETDGNKQKRKCRARQAARNSCRITKEQKDKSPVRCSAHVRRMQPRGKRQSPQISESGTAKMKSARTTPAPKEPGRTMG